MPRRSIDVAFTRVKLAIFLDGCFWHGCPEHGSVPASNTAWWRKKLDRNMARDTETSSHLTELGWSVVRIWEHEQAAFAVARVRAELGRRHDAAGG